MGVRESKVEKYLDDLVKNKGGITRKWVSPGRSGVPDRIVIYEGSIYFVEVKTSGGSLSAVQEREHVRLADKGAKVFTVRGCDGVEWWVESYLG